MTDPTDDAKMPVPTMRRLIRAEITGINRDLQAIAKARASLRVRKSELETALSDGSCDRNAITVEDGDGRTDSLAQPRAAQARLSRLDIRSPSGRTSSVSEPPEDRTSPPEPGVTDHAVVRYMERAMGFDLDDVRRRILTPAATAALTAGATRIRTAEGYLVAKDALVVSFLPHDALPGRRRKRTPGGSSEFRRSDRPGSD